MGRSVQELESVLSARREDIHCLIINYPLGRISLHLFLGMNQIRVTVLLIFIYIR